MTVTHHPTPLYDLIEEFQRQGLSEPYLLTQVVVILLSALAAWVFSRALRPKVRRAGAANWKVSSEGVARLLYPLIFWVSVEIGTVFWRGEHSVTLLRLFSSLLSVLVLVRALAYLLQAVFVQSEWVKRAIKVLAWMVWLVFALHITGALPEIEAGLIGIKFRLGKQDINLLMVINGVISVAVTVLLAMWLGRLTEQRVMAATSLDLSLRVVVTKVLRTILVLMGILIALPLVGIDLTVLSVFGGALGVGLGFGLQKVASNYVSGFIILLDGSIRIGDIVVIDNRQGTISSITSRYVLLQLGDGTEAIIPNETLITSTVLNLSHSNKLIRVVMPFLVAYGANLDLVSSLLLAAAAEEERILKDPAPAFFLKQFGDKGIELELAFWIGDPDQGTGSLRSTLNMQIWRAFSQHGIEIPNPRQEIHLHYDKAESGIEVSSSSTR
ncbi:mechanosensitive ion channel [Chitinimonas arctica]|uniref:Mechanosensitive ion channel n=1 Tax=Chitinimonas arctica TaxID=2594795 RepID=A0A516SGR4_9NEIS|nr:mechanosensitive ion channel domain-containing protein [Chitinimonas arctica]QDQ27354.1 mechanosensitive ion channel [Chitinimonas arctica]